MVEGFTKEYECHKLIYFEQMSDVNSAIRREKEIKKWRREKKINLIRTTNPGWRDLYGDYQKA
jgi:putative endonuclease